MTGRSSTDHQIQSSGQKRKNPLKSLEEQKKVSKKMADYQSEISWLNKSLAARKRKLAEAVTKDSEATGKKDAKKKG